MAYSDITPEIVARCLGKDAIYEKLLFGGIRITMPDGSSTEIVNEEMKNFAGGAQFYRGMLRIHREVMGDTVTAYAPSTSLDHLAAMCAHAEQEGMTCVPEVRSGEEGCLMTLVSVAVCIVCIIVADQWLDFRTSLIAGIVGAAILMVSIIAPAIETAQTMAARRRGQIVKDKFPTTPSRE